MYAAVIGIDSGYSRSQVASLANLFVSNKTELATVTPPKPLKLSFSDRKVPVSSSTTSISSANINSTASAPSVGDNSMYSRAINVLSRHTPANVLTFDSFKKVLKYLASPDVDAGTRDCAVKSFNGVTPQEFEALFYVIQESPLFPRNPRFAYKPQQGIVIVEFPRVTHEVPLTDLRDAIYPAIRQLPINNQLLRATLESNFNFISSVSEYSAIPDLSLVVMPRSGSDDAQILTIVECAFSQDQASLEDKVREELAARPEIVLAIMVLVNEAQDYHAPKEGSEAWNLFSKEEYRVPSSFLHLKESDSDADSGLNEEEFRLQPVTVAGHEWCNIASVEYRVWVKDDVDKTINIDKDYATHGTHYPQLAMSDVEAMIKKGLYKAKDAIVAFTKELRPTADAHTLEKADITLSIDWATIQSALVPAANLTAYTRYRAWHHHSFGTKSQAHGIKRLHAEDEDEYKDEEGQSDLGTSALSTVTPPVTRARKSRKLD